MVHPAAMASLRSLGLSAVRPEMRASRLAPPDDGGGDLAQRFVELHRVLLLGLLSEFREFRSPRTGRSGAEEPRFDDVTQLRGRTFPPEHLHGVIPSHPAEGGAATDEDHLGLIVGGGRASHCFWYL